MFLVDTWRETFFLVALVRLELRTALYSQLASYRKQIAPAMWRWDCY